MLPKSKPLLILAFNRPKVLSKTLSSLVQSQLKGRKIYFSIDGHRNQTEKVSVDLVEDSIRNFVKMHKLDTVIWRSKNNQGCKLGVSSAITKVLEKEVSVIILEDDCMPSKSFLPYCDYVLDKYESDKNVFMINGTSFVDNHSSNTHFRSSKCAFVWGWATWRRAWHYYDVDMTDLKSKSGQSILDLISNYYGKYSRSLISLITVVYDNHIDTWDAQWAYAIWKNKGRTVLPSRNLISNTGFGTNSTHTKIITNLSNRPLSEFEETKLKELKVDYSEMRKLDRLQYQFISQSTRPAELIQANVQAFLNHFQSLFFHRQ